MATLDRSTDIRYYWDWFAVALFVLVTVDMVTTMYAAAHAGPAAEANPLMRWAIGRGVAAMAAINLLAVVVAVGPFYLLMRIYEETPRRWQRHVDWVLRVWIAGLIVAGIVVLVNNVSVVVVGRSLVVP